jgi:crossover junction endodeoxyribonuclease RuvC
MLKLGRAQGVAIAAAMSANLSVTEYSPKKVKQSITAMETPAKNRFGRCFKGFYCRLTQANK